VSYEGDMDLSMYGCPESRSPEKFSYAISVSLQFSHRMHDDLRCNTLLFLSGRLGVVNTFQIANRHTKARDWQNSDTNVACSRVDIKISLDKEIIPCYNENETFVACFPPRFSGDSFFCGSNKYPLT
jgi:hypothetical protein